MNKKNSEKGYKLKIQFKNAEVYDASKITHQLYEMVDSQEIYSLSIDNVKKSPQCVEVVLTAVVIFLGGAAASKMLDISASHIITKIHTMLINWKRNKSQTKLDIFIDDKHIE